MNCEHISNDQYRHAQNVWNTFSLKAMENYHDLYLKSDILLLADVFENFKYIKSTWKSIVKKAIISDHKRILVIVIQPYMQFTNYLQMLFDR